MANKPKRSTGATPANPANSRQAKIQAAQKASGGGGANKITIAGIVAVLAIIAIVGGVIWSQQKSKTNAGSGNTKPPAAATVDGGYRAFADVSAKPNAPVVTVFEDFQCPACKGMESAIGSTISGLAKSGDIQLNYHLMNFLDDKTGAKQSTPVANAAFCAADQGKWQEFHDAAYAGQIAEGQSISTAQLEAFAKTAGLTGTALEDWRKCSDAGKYNAYIADSNNSAGKAGVTGTPTIKIGDTMYSGDTLAPLATPEAFTKAIADATKG